MVLTEKLSFIQQKMKAPKNLFNSFGKYSYRNAEGILEAFKPFESEYHVALIVTDDMAVIGDRVYVKATAKLMDCESQEAISTTAFAREAPEKKGMDDSQVTGTASSYARKYALNGLFLLDDTKDVDTDENRKESEVKSRGTSKGTTENPSTKASDSEIENLRAQLQDQCKRTGYGMIYLKKKYPGMNNLNELSKQQLKDVVEDLKKKPDKEAP